MTKPLRTETATDRGDVPHQFEGQKDQCGLCLAGQSDLKHVAWERLHTASRETAAITPMWERGS